MPLSDRTRRALMATTVVACAAIGLWLAWPPIAHVLATKIVEAKRPAVGKPAPDFTLDDTRGAHVSLDDYRGKVVVLNFWATWCGPCKIEIPWFTDFQTRYGQRPFTVLGVSLDDNADPAVWKAVQQYAAENKINYPVLRGTDDVNDLYGGIEALPTTLIIGRDGKVAYWHHGLISKSEYEKEIQELLR